MSNTYIKSLVAFIYLEVNVPMHAVNSRNVSPNFQYGSHSDTGDTKTITDKIRIMQYTSTIIAS